MLTEDYIVRMIRDMGQMLARVLGSQAWEPDRCAEVWEAAAARVGNLASTLEELKALCGRGEINAAENLLFEELDFSDPGTLPIALAFYEHLNRFSDQELEARDYSREEIFEGVKDCAEQYGVDPQLLEAFRP